jgi:hypothetical protein
MTTEQSHAEAVAADNATKNLATIVRGRMPAALVYVIRHVSHGEDVKDAALAKMYGTTPGKISDIKKNSNFKYIDADWKPSADDVEAGKSWAEKMRSAEWADEHVKTFADDVDERLAALEVASADVLAAQEEARKGSRKPRAAKAEGETEEPAGDVNVDEAAPEVTDDLSDLIGE